MIISRRRGAGSASPSFGPSIMTARLSPPRRARPPPRPSPPSPSSRRATSSRSSRSWRSTASSATTPTSSRRPRPVHVQGAARRRQERRRPSSPASPTTACSSRWPRARTSRTCRRRTAQRPADGRRGGRAAGLGRRRGQGRHRQHDRRACPTIKPHEAKPAPVAALAYRARRQAPGRRRAERGRADRPGHRRRHRPADRAGRQGDGPGLQPRRQAASPWPAVRRRVRRGAPLLRAAERRADRQAGGRHRRPQGRHSRPGLQPRRQDAGDLRLRPPHQAVGR